MSPSMKVVLIVLIVLLMLVGIFLLVLALRTRSRRGGEKGLRPNHLTKIYARFLGPLSWRARSTLRSYPWVVVLGDAGVGKTHLISSHVDWQGQLNQFFPSYTADPLMQVYLGGRVVVHELAAPLLADSSLSAQIALRRLWGPLCKRMPPTVMIVLSFRALRHSTPEQIERHAQLLRGKINLLSELSGQPVRTRICLTFMDRQPGFSEFVRLLSQHKLPISITLHTDSGELVSLEQGLTSYEKFLPLALTDLSASAFRTLVEFLVNSPSILSRLSDSLRVLGEEIPFSRTPGFDRLYFSADKLIDKLPNPFYVRSLQPGVLLGKPRSRPLEFLGSLFAFGNARAHIIGCMAVASLAAIIYGLIYFSHQRHVEAVVDAVAHVNEAVSRAENSLNLPSDSQAVQNAAQKAGDEILLLRRLEEGKPILYRLHKEDKETAQNQYLGLLRRAYLLPALERYRQPKDRDRLISTLGALYAGRYNTLGNEIRRTPAKWASDIGMPEEILLKYASISDPPFGERVPIPGPLPTQDVAQNPAADLSPWFGYLTVLDAAFTAPTISRAQLLRLQQVTRRFGDGLTQAMKNHAAEHTLRVLSEESVLDLRQLFGPALAALMPPAWISDNAERLNALFQMILTGSLEPPRAEPLQLTELMSLLNTQTNGAKQKDTVHTFELSGRAFRFSTLRWMELLANSRRQELLAGIGTGRSSRDAKPDKAHRSRGHAKRKSRHSKADAGVVALPSADSEPRAALTGSDSIPALYTRPGFEKEMKPNLLDAEKRLAAASLSAAQKQQVGKILMAQAKRYAKNYRDAQLSYLMGYKPSGDTLVGVVGMLTELLQSSSPLLERVRTIADNAALGPLPGPYLAPMNEQLPALAPIVRLATQKDGAYLEYDKYKAIISQLIKDVSSSSPDAPATAFAPLGTPTGAASPADAKAAAKPGVPAPYDAPTGAARVAVSVLQGQEDSPLRKIEAFLDAEGIVGDLRKPFIAPLLRVYKLGIRVLETAIDKRWEKEYTQSIAPLLERFPFNRRAKTEATPPDLEPLRPPGGAFWTFFAQKVAPLCSATERPDGALVPLRGPLGSVKLPEELLAGLSRLRRLSRALWTAEGEQKPIAMLVKALPLPGIPSSGSSSGQAAASMVTQTFLSCSNVSVNGFNQMPEAKPFPLPWWRQENSAVGVEIGVAGAKARRYQSIDVGSGQWSFYRLLDKAEWSEGNVAAWQIPGEGQGAPRPVRFAFDTDPFALFQLGALKPSHGSRSKDKETEAEP